MPQFSSGLKAFQVPKDLPAASADILPLGVQLGLLGLLSPEQQEWEQQF